MIDRRVALIGSANLTESAMERNLECGLMIRDRSVAERLVTHVEGLERAKHLHLIA